MNEEVRCASAGKWKPVLLTCARRGMLGAIVAAFVWGMSGCAFHSGPSTPPPQAIHTNKIVRTAYTQIGKKYRSGSASPQKGFDCSGLVWWSYKQHGISVPRITSDQARAGKAVSKKQARPGDIVVFRTSNSPRGLHTGIYCGEGRFIHSPSSGKRVCMETLASWWGDKVIAIRRINRK